MPYARLIPMLVGAALLSAAPAFAQMAATPAKATASKVTTTTRATKTNVPVQRTAKSLDCSKQADAKGLHGTPRKHFMSSCKKG